MPNIVISPYNVVNFSEGGGHFWVYMQYAQGLLQLGCNVYWLESIHHLDHPEQDAARASEIAARMEKFGLGGKLILYYRGDSSPDGRPTEYVGMTQEQAEAILREADLLLNFNYAMDPALLALFRRTALVDIDPGLLQFWISRKQLAVHAHDYYFTTGETVGTPDALFPDDGLPWIHIHPPVSLERWGYTYDPYARTFTTVSNWDGGEWVVDGSNVYDNSKRVTFKQFAELPHLTPQPLELALFLRTALDAEDRRFMEGRGWRIRHSREVAATPEMYQAFIQRSRGEFSCVKPSCIQFQNAWISDRSLCYLASGKPVVVQDTGPSSYLPNGEGLFRILTMEQAASALAAVNTDYERHCRSARQIAASFFDSKKVLEFMLSVGLSGGRRTTRS